MAQGDAWLFHIIDIYIHIYIYICFFFEDFNGEWKLSRPQIKNYKTVIAQRIRCLQSACNKAETRENPPQWAKELPWFVAGRHGDGAHEADDSQDKPAESSEASEDEDEEEEEEEDEDKDADSDEAENTEYTYGWDAEVKCAYRTKTLGHSLVGKTMEMAKAAQPPNAAAEDSDPYFATFADDTTHVAYRFAWKVQVDERIFPSCWIDRAWKHKYIYIERERGRE